MRLLRSGGIVAGMVLLVGAALPQASAAHRQVASRSTSAMLPIPAPISEPTPRRLPTPTPVVIPAVRLRPAVALAPRVKPKPAPAPAPVSLNAASGAGQVALINQDRAAAGLPPLQWNGCLANVAIGQAARMAAQGYISHANGRILDLGCHLGSRSGENIGVQWGIQDAAMNAWFMNDPPHRANILGPYHYVGAAWVIAGHSAYLAVEFG